jgi:DNA repair protein SbcD/Mre11
MPRFLHIADIHLGFDRYSSSERTLDFFHALFDVVQRYAIDEQVDFVVIAGDLFEHRVVLPAVLNQAQIVLQELQDAGIPVIAIEGNHDNLPYGTKTSWLRYLADWSWIMLLEPDLEAGDGDGPDGGGPDGAQSEIFQPWNPETQKGGYIDLDCGVRILGSRWYGASAPQAIARLAAGMRALPTGPDYNIMLLHHGMEGQIARYSGALRYSDILPLREAGVDYLALGHIHKNYELEGWVFNPGSLEANSVIEAAPQMVRGAYLVELTAQGPKAELKQDYRQRPIRRLTLDVEKSWSAPQVEAAALALIQAKPYPGAIVELRIRGQVGFNRLDVDLRRLQDQLKPLSQALIFLLKYEVTGTDYATLVTGDESLSRDRIESLVFQDLLAANNDYAQTFELLSEGLIDLKTELLADRPAPELYDLANLWLKRSQAAQTNDPQPNDPKTQSTAAADPSPEPAPETPNAPAAIEPDSATEPPSQTPPIAPPHGG